jgi:hypothetical protein
MNSYSLADITTRIMLVLPSKFTREVTSNVYDLFYGISSALKLDSDLIDELFKQTNLTSASGEYVDQYISELTELGRKADETDADYKTRYYKNVFEYNCTKNSIQAIVVDLTGSEPYAMYNVAKRGAFLSGPNQNARHYYDDPSFLSTYGDPDPTICTAYIQFSSRPGGAAGNQTLIDLCKTINGVRGAGIKIYLYYPND